MMNLPSNVTHSLPILPAISTYTELGRLYCHRNDMKEADKYYLKAATAAIEFSKTNQETVYSLQVRCLGDIGE